MFNIRLIKRRCWDLDREKKCHLLIQTGLLPHTHQASAKLWRYYFSFSSFYIWADSQEASECLDDRVVSNWASSKLSTRQKRAGARLFICIPALFPSVTNCSSCSLCLPSHSMFGDRVNTILPSVPTLDLCREQSLPILCVCLTKSMLRLKIKFRDGSFNHI